MEFLATGLLQILELVVEVDDLVDIIKRAIIHSIVSIEVFVVSKLVLFIIIIAVDVNVNVFLIFNDYLFTIIIYFGHLLFLATLKIFLPQFNALSAQIRQRLNNIWIVVLDTVWHLAVHEKGSESKNEALYLKIFFDFADFGKDHGE